MGIFDSPELAELFEKLKSSVECGEFEEMSNKIEQLEKDKAELVEVVDSAVKGIYPPLPEFSNDAPLKTSTGNFRKLQRARDKFKENGHGTFRGHPIIFKEEQWFYMDTMEPLPAFGGELRPCAKCGSEKWSGDGHVDECLGLLPGVSNACCGHGDRSEAYIVFNNGIVVRNFVVAESLPHTKSED